MRRLALLLVPMLMVSGCVRNTSSAPPGPTSPAPPLWVSKDVDPAGAPPRKARLILDGLPVPVTVKPEEIKGQYTINLLAHDELFDYEKYVVDSQSFSLLEGAGETYEPPIPILVFPFHLQQPPREWSGKMFSERNPHPAHATITIDKDSVPMGTSSVETVHVVVNMTLDGMDGQGGAERKLSFWFSKGMGLLKRQFGAASIREPVAE